MYGVLEILLEWSHVEKGMGAGAGGSGCWFWPLWLRTLSGNVSSPVLAAQPAQACNWLPLETIYKNMSVVV